MRTETDLATRRKRSLAVGTAFPTLSDRERTRNALRRVVGGCAGVGLRRARGTHAWRGRGVLPRARRRARNRGTAPARARRGARLQRIERFRCERDMRRGEITNRRRVRIRRRPLGAQDVAHLAVDHQVTVRAAEQLHQRELVVLIGLEAELPPMQAVGEDCLIELAHLERLREVLRKGRADCAHEMAIHPFDVIHRSPPRCCCGTLERWGAGCQARDAVRGNGRAAANGLPIGNGAGSTCTRFFARCMSSHASNSDVRDPSELDWVLAASTARSFAYSFCGWPA